MYFTLNFAAIFENQLLWIVADYRLSSKWSENQFKSAIMNFLKKGLIVPWEKLMLFSSQLQNSYNKSISIKSLSLQYIGFDTGISWEVWVPVFKTADRARPNDVNELTLIELEYYFRALGMLSMLPKYCWKAMTNNFIPLSHSCFPD